jgi:predicted nuclease of restriction endonuclease-like (RecB) superfamily
VSPLAAQLTWTNIVEVLTIDEQPKRDFYLAMCAHEHWSKRTLGAQIDGKLFERTVHAAGSVGAVQESLAALRIDGVTTPELAFHDPYVLDFLGLPSKHSEAELERAILDEMQRFLLELGADFCFVARQKRVIVDGADYYLDLLFYHRGMRCLVAIDLKTRHLKPGDKGQMELYLRWLEANETRAGEEPPVGLILCAKKGPQQTALLGLDRGEIRAAQYLTEPIREEMQRRLAAFTDEPDGPSECTRLCPAYLPSSEDPDSPEAVLAKRTPGSTASAASNSRARFSGLACVARRTFRATPAQGDLARSTPRATAPTTAAVPATTMLAT